MIRPRHPVIAVSAALLLGAAAHAANPPGPLDLPPTTVVPAPVDMTRTAPAEAPETQAPARPIARPAEPSGNPLWAVPLSMLTATRERPLFSPSRRAPAPAVAGPAAVAAPVAAPAPPPAEPDRPQLVLVGAIAGDNESFAVFLDQTTNDVIRLKTGQDHGGWVLRSVKGREATLQKDAQIATLSLPPPGGAPGDEPPASAPVPVGARPLPGVPGRGPLPPAVRLPGGGLGVPRPQPEL